LTDLKRLELAEIADIKKVCSDFFIRLVNSEPFVGIEGTDLLLSVNGQKIVGDYKILMEACKGDFDPAN